MYTAASFPTHMKTILYRLTGISQHAEILFHYLELQQWVGLFLLLLFGGGARGRLVFISCCISQFVGWSLLSSSLLWTLTGAAWMQWITRWPPLCDIPRSSTKGLQSTQYQWDKTEDTQEEEDNQAPSVTMKPGQFVGLVDNNSTCPAHGVDWPGPLARQPRGLPPPVQ